MDADNRVTRVNREFTRLFGYTPQGSFGRHIRELIVPDESRAEEQRYPDLVAQRQRVAVEGVRQGKDGSRLHVSIVRVPVSVPGGQIAVYGVYRDITERKRAEELRQTFSQRLLETQEVEWRRVRGGGP
jgi:PAS domain S-box-containing protein